MICLRPSNVTYWLFGNNGIYHTIHLSRPSASSSLSIWLFGPVSQRLIVSPGLKPIFSTMSWTPSSAVMFLLLWSWHKSCSTSVTWSKETSQLCRLIIFANISQSLRFHVEENIKIILKQWGPIKIRLVIWDKNVKWNLLHFLSFFGESSCQTEFSSRFLLRDFWPWLMLCGATRLVFIFVHLESQSWSTQNIRKLNWTNKILLSLEIRFCGPEVIFKVGRCWKWNSSREINIQILFGWKTPKQKLWFLKV